MKPKSFNFIVFIYLPTYFFVVVVLVYFFKVFLIMLIAFRGEKGRGKWKRPACKTW